MGLTASQPFASGARLAFEAGQAFLICGKYLRYDLDRNFAVEACVGCTIDDSHPAFADLLLNAVMEY